MDALQAETHAAPELTAQIRADALEYIDLVKQIKGVKDELKLINERKKELESQIADYMQRNKINVLESQNGNINMVVKQSPVRLNKDYIKETLTEKLKDEEAADDLTRHICENRPTETGAKIKVSKMKK